MEITSKIRNVLFYQSGKLEFKPLRWACSFFSLNVCVHVCGLPWWLRICLQFRRPRFKPWVRKIPWRREWQPTSALLPRECHRQSSLAGYSPWDLKELDTTEWLTHTHTHTHTHTRVCIYLILGKDYNGLLLLNFIKTGSVPGPQNTSCDEWLFVEWMNELQWINKYVLTQSLLGETGE